MCDNGVKHEKEETDQVPFVPEKVVLDHDIKSEPSHETVTENATCKSNVEQPHNSENAKSNVLQGDAVAEDGSNEEPNEVEVGKGVEAHTNATGNQSGEIRTDAMEDEDGGAHNKTAQDGSGKVHNEVAENGSGFAPFVKIDVANPVLEGAASENAAEPKAVDNATDTKQSSIVDSHVGDSVDNQADNTKQSSIVDSHVGDSVDNQADNTKQSSIVDSQVGDSLAVNVDDDSDGEIVDSDDDDDDVKPTDNLNHKNDYGSVLDVARPELDQLDYDEDVDEEGEIVEDSNAKPELEEKSEAGKVEKTEMSDGEIASSDGEVKSDNEGQNKPRQQGFRPEDFEEGEMVDPMDVPATPREVCRFYLKGNCTWGDRCRFIHPGVNDKGGYNMFGDQAARPPEARPPPPPIMDPRRAPMPLPDFLPPQPETAWERGLRHAKEMRRKALQRKVEEPDFMRKREVISCNEALNVDRDMDFIVQKPLVEEQSGYDPLNAFDDDARYAVPDAEEVKRIKRFEGMKLSRSRDDGRRSPRRVMEMRRSPSPRRGKDGRHLPPPGHPMHRDMHERGDRRSPPRGMGPHHRHQPPPMHPRDRISPPGMHPMRYGDAPYRDQGPQRGRHDRDFRDRRMDERDRGFPPRGDPGWPLDGGRSPRREVESRVIPVGKPMDQKSRSQVPGLPPHGGRGDVWSDPWARGRQPVPARGSRSSSGSSSSGSSSRSSFSSQSDSSFSSRSSSSSSSFSSSGSSRSPPPRKANKKLTKTKGTKPEGMKSAVQAKTAIGKTPAPVATIKKEVDKVATAKKPLPPGKPSMPATAKPPAQPGAPAVRGRPTAKGSTRKQKTRKKSESSSSSSEFSHSSSSGSRSKGRASTSDSGSGSSTSSSGSGSSSSGSSDSSDDESAKKNTKAVRKTQGAKPPGGAAKPMVGKVSVPSKPGKKNVKMTIINKPQAQAKPAASDSRKRSAAQMSGGASGAKPGTKKVSAIATRRVELLEQLKVVENAILKKRAKLT